MYETAVYGGPLSRWACDTLKRRFSLFAPGTGDNSRSSFEARLEYLKSIGQPKNSELIVVLVWEIKFGQA